MTGRNSFKETLLQGAQSLAIPLEEQQLEQFYHYWRLLVEWNQKFNLTAIVEEKEVIVKHFLDSLTCFAALSLPAGSKVIDIGTGAGFPGVPLFIKEPGLRLTLVDSLQKRTIFLKELLNELGLPPAEVIHGRAEELGANPGYRETYDLAVTRAVAKVAVIAEYCLPLVRVGGSFLAMKGPELEEEVLSAQKAVKLLGGGKPQVKAIVLPFLGDRRNLLLIPKVTGTPPAYPRKPGLPAKKPLS